MPGFVASSNMVALLQVVSTIPPTGAAGAPASWRTFPIDTLGDVAPAVLLIGLPGTPLFGIFATIILIMFFASAISTGARSRGNRPRLGLVIGLLALVIVTLVINIAVR